MARSADELAVRITEAVSDAGSVPVEALPPLADTVDPEALDVIVPSAASDPRDDVTVAFSYAGQRVFICSGNTVYVRPARGPKGDPAQGTNATE